MSKVQISKHIFAPNGGYCVYYPSNLFCNTVLKIGEYPRLSITRDLKCKNSLDKTGILVYVNHLIRMHE